ncbi:MAG: hypothetical protein LBP79_01725 [Clostridiales bacterium]|jgi:hypothetical protein|nr:hypothetical protein [Clostridiales bacterium]
MKKIFKDNIFIIIGLIVLAAVLTSSLLIENNAADLAVKITGITIALALFNLKHIIKLIKKLKKQ